MCLLWSYATFALNLNIFSHTMYVTETLDPGSKIQNWFLTLSTWCQQWFYLPGKYSFTPLSHNWDIFTFELARLTDILYNLSQLKILVCMQRDKCLYAWQTQYCCFHNYQTCSTKCSITWNLWFKVIRDRPLLNLIYSGCGQTHTAWCSLSCLF